MQRDLAKLMSAAQAGDRVAYGELLSECEIICKRILGHRIPQPEIVEDLVQEVLISVDRAKQTYNPRYPFRPWINAIVQHRLADYWRKSMRISKMELQDEEQVESAITADNGDFSEQGDDIRMALNDLPQKQRRALLLTKQDGFSVKEVALQMEITESAVKVNVHRALRAMREMLLGKSKDENQ